MNKYRNIKVKSSDGSVFDSKLEYSHYLELKMLERAGKIAHLKKQVLIPLGIKGAIKYRADFVYYDLVLKKWIVFDSKGIETKEFKVKLKWLLESYNDFYFVIAKKHIRETAKAENVANTDFKTFIFEYIEKKQKKVKRGKNEKN